MVPFRRFLPSCFGWFCAELFSHGGVGLGEVYDLAISPEAFEIVVFTNGFVEDMDKYIGEIQQDPVARGRAFAGIGTHLRTAPAFENGFCNALDLPVRTAGTDDEVFGDRRQVADFDQ